MESVMIARKTMFTQQKRLLRFSGARSPIEPDMSGLTVNDYDILCKAHAPGNDKSAGFARKSRSLILK